MSRILTDQEVTTLGEDVIAWSGLVPKGYEGISYGLFDLALGSKTMLLNKVPSAAHNIVSIKYATPAGQKPSLIQDIKVYIEKLSKNNQRYRHEIELKEPTFNPRATNESGASKPVKKPNTGEENIINKVESDVVDVNNVGDYLENLKSSPSPAELVQKQAGKNRPIDINTDHILNGEIKVYKDGSKSGVGGHYLRDPNIRVDTWIGEADANGVTKGYISVRDPETGKWYKNQLKQLFSLNIGRNIKQKEKLKMLLKTPRLNMENRKNGLERLQVV
ncbi:hypothetical protein PT276_06305 [Orbaceae bacterium ESL0721]|nr:hypothetical protein [Orbaceae bacterium ESL0721]